jgi:hypothetical protein
MGQPQELPHFSIQPEDAARRASKTGFFLFVTMVIVQIFGHESLLSRLFPKILMVRIYTKRFFIFRLYGLETWRLPSKE